MQIEPTNVNQLLILAMIREGDSHVVDIALKLGMTKQGVLYHIKELKKNGYVDAEGRITKTGYNHLASGLGGLSRNISVYMNNIYGSEPWEAIADDDFSIGDTAYLSMRGGYLRASVSAVSECSGRCVQGAARGESVVVSGIVGIMDLRIGSVKIVVIPSGKEKDLHREIEEKRREMNPDLVGAVGEAGITLAREMGPVNLEYAVFHGAFEAARRGMSTMVLVSEARFRFELSTIEEISSKLPEVAFRIEYV